jgi:hypothetical protein
MAGSSHSALRRPELCTLHSNNVLGTLLRAFRATQFSLPRCSLLLCALTANSPLICSFYFLNVLLSTLMCLD